MKITPSFWRPRQRKHARATFRPRLERLEPRITPTGHDTLMTALTPALDGSPTYGTLADLNQVDLYVIQPVKAGDELNADLNAPNGGGPGDALRLFDANGKQLAFQENPVGGGDTLLKFDAVAAGPYYVGVSSNGDYTYDPTASGSGKGGLAQGDYTLNLTLTAGAILKMESPTNYSVGAAQRISGTVDSSITGQSVLQGTYAIGQTEYYRFNATQTGGLTAAATPGTGTGFLPRLALYDNNGQLLIQSDANPGAVSAQLNQNLQKGTYYLGASAVAGSDGQPYVLATSFNSASPPFQPLPVGVNPEGVAAGDFNHDGNMDIVTANYDANNGTDNTVSVLLGNGDGTFRPQATYSVSDGNGNGAGPVSVTVGDFNHDGNLDIVTANYYDNTVSVLLGNGDGTFQSAVTYAVGTSPEAVAVGHFTNDGNLDIVTANYADNTVSVLLGDGHGAFQPATTYAVGAGPESVAVGEFTNDGNMDIVTANNADGTVSVLLGDGHGAFQPATTYAVGNNPTGVAVGDFDGHPDIVTANYTDGTVSVLLGDGKGAFQNAVAYKVGVEPRGVAVGDFNGHTDIVAVNNYSNSVSVLLGDGHGDFRPAVAYSVGYQPYAAAVADFNHDGRLDIAAVNYLDNTASVLSGNGDGTFTSPPSGAAVGQTPFGLATADFNRDGALDLVTANAGNNTLSVLLGNGDGTFQPAVSYEAGIYPTAVAVADFNNDGNMDVVAADYGNNRVSVLLGRGDGTFLPAASYTVGVEPYAVAVGDFNGHTDIVTANLNYDATTNTYGPGTVSVLLGNGDGTFQPQAATYAVGISPYAVAVGDFNGRLGIVTTDYNDSMVSVLLGDGKGGFLPAVTASVSQASMGIGPYAVAVGNFDGHVDIVTANSGDNTVSVLLGDGKGGFRPAVTYAVGVQPNSVAVGDFNSDSRMDIVTSNYGDNTVSVLLGNGDGTFQPSFTEKGGDHPHAVVVGDFNNDGNLDVATADLGDNSVLVSLGSGRGPFESPATFPLGLPAQGIAFGSDQFGNDAIVTANPTQNQVSVLLGYEDGTAFLPPAKSYTVGKDPVAVAVGHDPDYPSIFDIFAANKGDNTVSALVENADGSFGTATSYSITDANGHGIGPVAVAVGVDPSGGTIVVTADSDGWVSVLGVLPYYQYEYLFATYQVGNNPVAVALAYDTQGNLDIFVADSDGTVTVLRGDANDSFTPGSVIQLDPGLDAVAVGYDKTGNDILAVANAVTNKASVLVGNPDGTSFQPAVLYDVGNDPESVAVGPVNNGGVDIVTANAGDGTVSVLRGSASDTFQPATTYKVGPHPDGVGVAYDTYGNLVILTTNTGDNTASELLGDTPFRISTPQNGVASRNIPYLQDLNGARDANGNPIPDEVILDRSGDILFRQGVAGSDQFASPAVLNPGHPARDAVVYRTASGYAVAAIDETGNSVSIYTWNGAGFVRTFGFATGNTPVRIAAYDLTGDGLDDLVVANDFDGSVTIAFQMADGQFGDLLTRLVGSAPSDVTFADVDGRNGPDIVVSDQASGDYSVLFNDPTHSFNRQSRYRAGGGLFDIDDSTGRQTIVSQLLTAGVVAGSFAGAGSEDLVVLNRGARSITLLPNRGQGSFTDPQSGPTYATGDQPAQIVKLTLPGDTLPSVAVLMLDSHQIWIYRNNNQGGFLPPVKIDAGNDPTDFSVQTIDGTLALLVGNAYGDVLTLLYDGNLYDANHGFTTDRSGLNSTPLAVGTTASGQEFAVVADQQLDKAYLYYRIPGTTRFGSPVVISATSQLPLLAPGAVQTFTVPDDSNPYLIVANSLSNDVLLYHYDPTSGGFDLLQRLPVGDDPVSITVADVNGDNVPDLLVANKGSNDVSVLIGSTATGVWTATPYQRLNSGGLGPLSVAVQNTGGANGPSLLITNSDGTVTPMAGIGSGGRGTGFFQDANPQPVNVGVPIQNAVFIPSTGLTFAIGPGGVLGLLNNGGFTSLNLQGVADLTVVQSENGNEGDFVAAGFDNGSISLLSADGTFVGSAPTGFTDISALQALQIGNEVDVFVTEAGQDVPVLIPFFVALVTEPPTPGSTAQGTGLPGFDLVLVATLLPGNLMESVNETITAAPGAETFALFLSAEGGGTDDAPQDQEAIVEVAVVGADASDVPALEQYVLGVAEALEQRLKDQQIKDTVEDFLDALKAALDQFFKDLAKPPAALLDLAAPAPPGPPAVGMAAGGEAGGAAMVLECGPEGWPPAPPEARAAPGPAVDVFTCVELLPSTAAPTWPPEAGDGLGWSARGVGPVVLSTYLAWHLGLRGWRRDREERRKAGRMGVV